MINRRRFLSQSATAAPLLAASQFPFEAMAADQMEQSLSILHTNDAVSYTHLDVYKRQLLLFSVLNMLSLLIPLLNR